MAETTHLTVLDATVDTDTGIITIAAFSDEDDTCGELKVWTKTYDKSAKRFSESAEAIEAADKMLTNLFGVTCADVITDPDSLADKEFDAYVDTETGNISDHPAKTYYSYDKVKSQSKVDDALAAIGAECESLPVIEARSYGIGRKSGQPYSQHRFEIPFKLDVNGDGNPLTLRISRIIIPDGDTERKVSLDYKDSASGGATNERGYNVCNADKKLFDVLNGVYDKQPEKAQRFKEYANKVLDIKRNQVVEQILEATGVDLDKLVDEGGTVHLTHIKSNNSGSSIWFSAQIG